MEPIKEITKPAAMQKRVEKPQSKKTLTVTLVAHNIKNYVVNRDCGFVFVLH